MGQTFTSMLDELNQGAFVDDCQKALDEIRKAMRDNGGSGTLTITLKVKPDGDKTVLVLPEVKAKKPGRHRIGTVMFESKEGLSAEQPTLFDRSNVRSINSQPRAATREFITEEI